MAPNASGIHELDHHRIIVSTFTAPCMNLWVWDGCYFLCYMQELCRVASDLAAEVLCEGGIFLCKALQGAHLTGIAMHKRCMVTASLVTKFVGFLASLKESYKTVKECRLKSTRKESTEIYLLAKRFLT